MKTYKKNNIIISIVFFVIISTFIYLPNNHNSVKAKDLGVCSLLWDVGCDLYYCWSIRFNDMGCQPCSNSGC